MSWSNRFDEPIQLPNGQKLSTLRQAAQYILALPELEHRAREWRTAMRRIVEAADHGGQIDLARQEILRALEGSGSSLLLGKTA